MSTHHTKGPSAREECREIDRIATLRYIGETERGKPVSYCGTNARTLERRGWVVKKPHSHGRASYVITDAGRAALDEQEAIQVRAANEGKA